jgi:hypothetical protein
MEVICGKRPGLVIAEYYANTLIGTEREHVLMEYNKLKNFTMDLFCTNMFHFYRNFDYNYKITIILIFNQKKIACIKYIN